jgi:hypothetical protein
MSFYKNGYIPPSAIKKQNEFLVQPDFRQRKKIIPKEKVIVNNQKCESSLHLIYNCECEASLRWVYKCPDWSNIPVCAEGDVNGAWVPFVILQKTDYFNCVNVLRPFNSDFGFSFV